MEIYCERKGKQYMTPVCRVTGEQDVTDKHHGEVTGERGTATRLFDQSNSWATHKKFQEVVTLLSS